MPWAEGGPVVQWNVGQPWRFCLVLVGLSFWGSPLLYSIIQLQHVRVHTHTLIHILTYSKHSQTYTHTEMLTDSISQSPYTHSITFSHICSFIVILHTYSNSHSYILTYPGTFIFIFVYIYVPDTHSHTHTIHIHINSYTFTQSNSDSYTPVL